MRRLRVGKANVSYMATPKGYKIQQDSSGNLGIFRADGTELGFWTQDRFIFVGQNGIKNLEINLNSQGSPLFTNDPFLTMDNSGNLYISCSSASAIYAAGNLATYGHISIGTNINAINSIYTIGFGVEAIYGLDNRTSLTSADTSPITLYPQSSLSQPAIASGQLYRLTGRILATAGTGPSATYTLKWTEGGAVITKSLTISALDSDSDFTALIQPDANTSITAQLTAIGGTGTTVNVAAVVERLA